MNMSQLAAQKVFAMMLSSCPRQQQTRLVQEDRMGGIDGLDNYREVIAEDKLHSAKRPSSRRG